MKTGDEVLRDVFSSALKHCGEALAPVAVPCPKCGHELDALCLAKVPERQPVTLKITFGEGTPDVETIGEAMVNFAKMYRELMKDYGVKCATTVHSMSCDEKSFEVKMIVSVIDIQKKRR